MPGASSWSLFLTTAGSQRECLVVNALAGNPEVLGDGDQFRDESLRTADEYVAPVQVGNEPRQRALVERYPLAAADQLMQLAAAVPDQFPHLLAEHKIFFSGGPQYDDRSAGPRQVFQQRSQCRDADPGCHQQSFRPLLRVPRECPVWSLDGNRCTRPQPRQRSGVMTSTFDGEPEVRRPGQCGQRVRVGLPPHVPGEEPPEEELAAGHGQSVEVTAADDHRGHPRARCVDLHDMQPMAAAAHDGQPETVAENQPRGCKPGCRTARTEMAPARHIRPRATVAARTSGY